MILGLKKLSEIDLAYFDFVCQSGNAAQGNIVSGETLKEAQLHPEQYSTLQIRVCGWNRRICKKPSHGEESGSACLSQLCGEKVQLSGTRIPDQGDSATDKRRIGNCT